MRLVLLIGLAAAGLSQTAVSQPLPWAEPADVPLLSGDGFASLLTMMPGEEVYSRFGHTALRVTDPRQDLDRTYNYGVFDFNQPLFVLRFLRGQLDYQLAISTYDRTIAEYRFLDRPVIEQRLNLTHTELQRLFLFLETNYLPQNRVYRYDFLFDNCSTRPRDAIEWATAGRLSIAGYEPPPGTFRQLIKPYTAGDPWLDFGIDLGFGRPVDRLPSAREAVFLPLELFEAFEVASIGERPAVARTDTLFWLPEAGLPQSQTHFPAILTTLLLAVGVLLTLWPASPGAARTWFDFWIFAIVGLLGLLLTLLWLATEHFVTYVNPDLLWAWPIHLGAALLILRRVDGPRVRLYFALAAATAATGGLLGLIGMLAMSPAAVPLALLVALRCADHASPAQDGARLPFARRRAVGHPRRPAPAS